MVVPKSFVRKTVLTQSKGTFPGEGSECKINVLDYPKNDRIPKSLWIEKEGMYSIVLGEADCEFDYGLEYALTIMNQKEKSVIELGFNDHGCKMTVELLEFSESVPFFKLDSSKKLETAKRHKDMGVNLFKSSLVREAFHRFSKSTTYIVPLRTSDTTDEAVTVLYFSVCNNMALCHLQLGNYEHVITLCEKVLSSSPTNVKALFRRAEALMKLRQFSGAADDLKKLISIEPSNKAALKNLQILQKELDKEEKNYKSMVKRMFN